MVLKVLVDGVRIRNQQRTVSVLWHGKDGLRNTEKDDGFWRTSVHSATAVLELSDAALRLPLYCFSALGWVFKAESEKLDPSLEESYGRDKGHPQGSKQVSWSAEKTKVTSQVLLSLPRGLQAHCWSTPESSNYWRGKKKKEMKSRMFGGMSLAWCFPLMPVGPVCLHRSLGVWNSYQMPLTEPYIGFAFCSCFIIYLNNFNSHGCFYYLSPERADIRERKQTLKNFRK